MFGICISPTFFPDSVEDKQLNVPYYRSILYTLEDLELLKSLNRPLVITLNNECREVGSDWSGWDNAVYYIASTLREKCLLFNAGNELDLFWVKNNQDVPPTFAASLAIRAARICHQFGIKVAPTSLASAQWPLYLEMLSLLCKDEVDYFDFHGYGKKPAGWRDGQDWLFGNLSDAISYIENITRKPTVMTEYGVKIGDAGSEEEVANFLSAANNMLDNMPIKCWFAYSDFVGAPYERGQDAFGLKSEDGIYRPAWSTMMEINKGQSTSSNPLDKWIGRVGTGLLEMMRMDGTVPVMASEWRPFDRPTGTAATVEQCVAENGNTYMWILPTKKGYVLKGEFKMQED